MVRGSCVNPYPDNYFTTAQMVASNAGYPNKFRITSTTSFYPPQPLTPGMRTYAMELDLKTEGTLADCDPTVDNTPGCTEGCLTPACLLLKTVTIYMDPESGNPNPDIIHYFHDGGITRSYCVYQYTHAYCWNTPVQSSTWGSIKALYR